DLLNELERIGESKVRENQMRTEYGNIGSPRYLLVERWSQSKDDARKSEAQSRKESRDEMSLSISRKDLFNSRCATIVAIIAVIVAASDKVIAFLRWLGILKP